MRDDLRPVLTLRRPSAERLREVLLDQALLGVTYAGIGATLDGELPQGYRHDRVHVVLGHGHDCFESAKAALADWAPHRRSGLEVSADGPIAVGTTVALAAPLPVGFAIAACRIVAVMDEAFSYGFAYGTLPEHPEEGEELFLVEDIDGEVRFTIVAFSRPHALLTRLGGPIARALQVRATRRYLDAMAEG